ncbi:MAG: NUDIX hydrolase [Myxococcota bacterium]
MSHSYEYPRPALCVDTVVFGYDDGVLRVLLIERGLPPFKGSWALPGGFVRVGESLDTAARRELEEEASVRDVYLEQLYTFGDPKRDPREHVVSVAYFALVKSSSHQVEASTDASNAKWFNVTRLPELAFDHRAIVDTALERLRGKIRYQPIGFELLPERFPLRALQSLYEAIAGAPVDKRNFRKKVLSMGLLHELDEFEKDVSHRAARLYRFDQRAYKRLTKQGFEFSL